MGDLFNNLHQRFLDGGPLEMGAITIVLLISIVIIIERAIRLWRVYDLPNSEAFVAQIQKMVMNNSIENAIRLCKKARPTMLPYVLAEGLKRANDTTEEIQNAMEHATLKAVPQIAKWVPFLATTANVATLLGLLGTIHGLMRSFGALGTLSGDQKQEVLASGISQALNATFYGLGTALVCLMAYGILSMKQKNIIDAINESSAKLNDLLYTRKMKIKKSGQ
jgi:biopolymer transport protein ExbB